MSRFFVIVTAAGRSQRMAGQNKMLVMLDGKPLLCHTLQRLQDCDFVDAVCVTCPEGQIESYRELFGRHGLTKIQWVIEGGSERQYSIHNALQAMTADPDDLVGIHDGARPFLGREVLERLVGAAPRFAGVLPTVAVKDTIKRALKPNGEVLDTVDRSQLFAAQTPQVFRFETIAQAHQRAFESKFLTTDDCALIEAEGGTIGMVEGDYRNIKITTPEDLRVAQVWVRDFV